MSYLTQQKKVVSEIFEHSEHPLTVLEAHALARRDIPTLGIATVYRAIKQFVEEGRVRSVDIPGATPHYENASRHHHHFFLCRGCSRLFNIAGCPKGIQSLAPAGFHVDRHEIVLYGECSACVHTGH